MRLSQVFKKKKTETRSSLLFDEKASRLSSHSSPAFRPWKSHDNASNNLTFGETSDLDRANRHEVFTPHSSAVFFHALRASRNIPQHVAAEFLFLHPPSTPKTLTSFSVQRTVRFSLLHLPKGSSRCSETHPGRSRPSDTPAFPLRSENPE